MKRLLPLFGLMLMGIFVSAQCDDLFISEYVEGYANNKALEIYNPTESAINLSDYSLARFSNGNTVAGNEKVIQLPDFDLQAHDVYVIVVDLTDTDDWDTQFDKPAWNGFNVIDTIYDAVTGEPVLDDNGNVLIGPQYLDGSALFGDEYNEEYDLQCKADVFLCPVYDDNNTMYFNGNDAVVLMKGTQPAADGSNIVDVIGVIGEDPTVTIMQDAWVDADGGWLTKDKTLVRDYDVATGRNALNEVVSSVGGTFTGEGWIKHGKNDFSYLGIHNSVCNTESTPDKFSCSLGALSTTGVNLIAFDIFPNPNGIGSLQIEAEESIQKVEIFNVVGQRISIESFNGLSNSTNVNLTEVENGMYLVKVHFANNHFSLRKLIVE